MVSKQETLQHYEVVARIPSENADISISSTISSCKNNVAIATKPNDGDNCSRLCLWGNNSSFTDCKGVASAFQWSLRSCSKKLTQLSLSFWQEWSTKHCKTHSSTSHESLPPSHVSRQCHGSEDFQSVPTHRLYQSLEKTDLYQCVLGSHQLPQLL